MTGLRNFFYAVGLVIGGIVLLTVVLPVEVIQEIKWRMENAKTN